MPSENYIKNMLCISEQPYFHACHSHRQHSGRLFETVQQKALSTLATIVRLRVQLSSLS